MPSDSIHFPVLDNGMLTHLPVDLQIEKLTRASRFPDGSVLFAAAESRTRFSWTLRFDNVNDPEWQRILGFIDATKRGAAAFPFYDPLGNLLAHSGDLEDSIWLAPPGLTVDPILDAEQPKSFILTNPTSQPLALSQSVSIAGPFTTCFSLLAKWPGTANFSIALSDNTNTLSISRSASSWSRHHVRLVSTGSPDTRIASIIVPPTTQVIVAAPQLEIGASPGPFLETGSQSGVFPNAWLTQKSFDTQSIAPGAHSITLRIESLR